MAFDIAARNETARSETDRSDTHRSALRENEIRGLDALDLGSSTPPRAHAVWRAAWPKLAAIALALCLWQLVAVSGWRPLVGGGRATRCPALHRFSTSWATSS